MRVVLLTVLLAACAGAPVERSSQAQREIERVTEAVYLGNDRVMLTTDKPFLLDVEGLEFALLARAAGEAVDRNADSFAIVHAEYHQRGALIEDDFPALGRTWIGTYERLLRHREAEERGFGKVSGVTFVVKLQGEDEVTLRQSFDSDETYDAMMDAWVNRRKL